MTTFLRELVAIFIWAVIVTTVFALAVRYFWRRGKHLEEP